MLTLRVFAPVVYLTLALSPTLRAAEPSEPASPDQQTEPGIPECGTPSPAPTYLHQQDYILVSDLNSAVAAQAEMALLAGSHSHSPLVGALASSLVRYRRETTQQINFLGQAHGVAFAPVLSLHDEFHLKRLMHRYGVRFDNKFIKYEYNLLLDVQQYNYTAARYGIAADVRQLAQTLGERITTLLAASRYVDTYRGTVYDDAVNFYKTFPGLSDATLPPDDGTKSPEAPPPAQP